MRSDLRSIIGSFLDGNAVPSVLCSDYSAFDALSEITGDDIASRKDVTETPRSDVFAFEPTIKTKEATYSVADVRGIIEKSHLSSGASDRKVVVLFDADTMTVEAANAFLKTLEDVPKDTLFLLTVTNRARLIETVLSRCVFIDSGDTVLEAGEKSKQAIRAFFDSGDSKALARLMFQKPDRSECLAILSLFSAEIRRGNIRDSDVTEAISRAFSTIASTNVTPYWELDRVVLRLLEKNRTPTS